MNNFGRSAIWSLLVYYAISLLVYGIDRGLLYNLDRAVFDAPMLISDFC